jgi:hypothetical protein
MSNVPAWEPLSVRRGLRDPGGLSEGVSAHLRGPLMNWLEEALQLGSPSSVDRHMIDVAVAARVSSAWKVSAEHLDNSARREIARASLMESILNACDESDDLFLDIIDATLHLQEGRNTKLIRRLQRILAMGGSAWTVANNGCSLQRRVDASAEAAFRRAAKPLDIASEELANAWAAAYGRDPDPSDAWDHAIKAVEAAIIPVVCPKQNKPTLGHALGELDRQRDHWRLRLPGPDGAHGVEPLVGMLRLLWPNPDRHGSADRRRVPTAKEAENIVQLAVTLVQWSRDGAIGTR